MPPRATTTATTAVKSSPAKTPAKAPAKPRASTRKAAAPSPTVNTQQFSGNMSHLGGLYTNMTSAGLTADSKINDHMGAFRRNLYHAAAATALEHPTMQSLGHALDVNPTMHGFNTGDAVTVPKNKIRNALGKAGSAIKAGYSAAKTAGTMPADGGGSRKSNVKKQQRKFGSSGNNARVLKGATGAL